MLFRHLVTALFAFAVFTAVANARSLTFLVPESSLVLPYANAENGQVRSGLHRDLAELLGERLNHDIEYIIVPRARVDEQLNSGKADIRCYTRPDWSLIRAHYTQPILTITESIVRRADTPSINSIAALEGQRIGTVTGYYYPVLDHFGADMAASWRDNAPSHLHNLEKLKRGRIQYVYMDDTFLAYRGMEHSPWLVRDFEINRFNVYCAVLPGSPVTVDRVNSALTAMIEDGSWQAVLSRYRLEDFLP